MDQLWEELLLAEESVQLFVPICGVWRVSIYV